MTNTTAFAGKQLQQPGGVDGAVKEHIHDSILHLSEWLELHEYRGYDTFDGLNAKFLRQLTFETDVLRTVLQQAVRRFPINLRPVLGIRKDYSTKGMGFLARGFLRLYRATGDDSWKKKAEATLQWLNEHRSGGYSGACWGNHFDYQSRSFYLPKGVPTVVWTSLIGHAFLDAYDQLPSSKYLETAVSACEHIVNDLERFPDADAICIGYIPANTPAPNKLVHNSNTLAASLLARTFSLTRNSSYRDLAEKAILYTVKHQLPNGAWYYGEPGNLHWVDNFHTAYVLDSLKHYADCTGDGQFDDAMMKGYEYWKRTFFLSDGTPRYYDRKTLPLDIQCCSQAIDTLTFFNQIDPENLTLATKVAKWTIDKMQDKSGYFYYRRYASGIVNKTPTLHWGQATMLCALSGLYARLCEQGYR